MTTELGKKLFAEGGFDPYMENPATTWLLHWNLCSQPTKTTWFWAFNDYPAISFGREQLVTGLCKLADERSWSRASPTTIKKDVDCLVRTYVPLPLAKNDSQEKVLESPFAELGVIIPSGNQNYFQFVRGEKSSLGMGVFGYALATFWADSFPTQATLSFEALMYEPGSPGKVFQLDEGSLIERLSKMEDISDGFFKWSETAGLKQLARRATLDTLDIDFIASDYSLTGVRHVA